MSIPRLIQTQIFGEHSAHSCSVCFDVESVGGNPELNIAYSESHLFADWLPDATTDRQERDLALNLEFGDRTGTVCLGKDFVRGGFKYLTLQMPVYPVLQQQDQHKLHSDSYESSGHNEQQVLGQTEGGGRDPYGEYWVSLRNLWVECTAFPSQSNGRAYSGYFYSSSRLLNRIWYAGAYTLQLSTIDPKEGSALIDYNRRLDHNKSPTGSWYSNFTIANGTAVTTDGAKRDRMVWPGDMYIAVPGIAMSTYDMSAVRNALETLFVHQYSDGSLPYAGPPMGYSGEFSDTYHMHTLLGVYNYVLYSGDMSWLKDHWQAYLTALDISIGKVDETGLLHVTSTNDWLRPGMTGHNLEASAMLITVLAKSAELADWLGDTNANRKQWAKTSKALHAGIQKLYCPSTGLYSDNIGRRSCHGPEHVEPQDGNSWALISGAAASPSDVSSALSARWLRHGAPAVEYPNVISPFASSFELLAHAAASHADRALELALLEWSHLLDGHGFTNSTLAEGFRVDGHPQYPAYWSAARNSHCHGWSSGPTSLVVSDAVLGIKLLGPAGDTWQVRPRLTKWLSWARGGFATTRGRFESRLSRVSAIDQRDGAVVRSNGLLIEFEAPPGTNGSLVVEADGAEMSIDVLGGGRVVYVLWDATDVEEFQDLLEELDLSGDARLEAASEEEWHLQTIRYRPGVRLMFDEEFEEAQMQEREVGAVDWDALEKHYATPLSERSWKASKEDD